MDSEILGKSPMMIEEQVSRPISRKAIDFSQDMEEFDLENMNNPQYFSMYAKPVFDYIRQIEVKRV